MGLAGYLLAPYSLLKQLQNVPYTRVGIQSWRAISPKADPKALFSSLGA